MNNPLSLFLVVFMMFQTSTSLCAETQPDAAASKAIDLKTEKISVDYRDTDLTAILRSLSYTYGLNLVTSSEVKGKVTISLKDVTVDEALEAVLSSQGLVYSRKGNIVYVSTAGAEESVALMTEPFSLKYLKAVEAQNLLRKSLSTKGDIKVDEVSNSMLVSDFPANIDKVRELLQKIDLPPDQVLIEAKLVDITTSDFRNLGMTWNLDYKPPAGTKDIFGNVAITDEEIDSTFTLPGTSAKVSGGQFAIDTFKVKNIAAGSATLDALIQNRKAHLLASPAIAVLNNQEARIVIGEKVPFKERTQTTTGTTETTQFIDVGTTLRVTPSINSDGYITMRIHPEVSSVSDLLDAGPRITTREADTTVRIKEGETIVIAGLIKQETGIAKSKIPFLGQIPILEYAFSSRHNDQSQTELAVFITPHILRSRDQIERMSKEEEEKNRSFSTTPTMGQLGVVLEMFRNADHLETGNGYEAQGKPEWFRVSQGLNVFEHIAEEFPDSPQAPEALWRIAKIKAVYYKDVEGANIAIKKLMTKYPKSDAVPKAQKLLKVMEDQSALFHETLAGAEEERKIADQASEERKLDEQKRAEEKKKAEELKKEAEAKKAEEQKRLEEEKKAAERKKEAEEKAERRRIEAEEKAERRRIEAEEKRAERQRRLEEQKAEEELRIEELRLAEQARQKYEAEKKRAQEEALSKDYTYVASGNSSGDEDNSSDSDEKISPYLKDFLKKSNSSQ